jgi:dCMP deaminase
MSKRPDWHTIWMDLAVNLSKRSTCSRLSVGSVVVSTDNARVLAVGYNGNYHGGPNQCDSTVPGACGCLHSEDNCLLKMNFHDNVSKIMYVTHVPCKQCAKRIINAGIDKVIYLNEYRDMSSVELLKSVGIEMEKYLEGSAQ